MVTPGLGKDMLAACAWGDHDSITANALVLHCLLLGKFSAALNFQMHDHPNQPTG